MSAPRIALVVAVARNGIIGADGDMPWKLSSDLKRFRSLTMGHPVVMGRKTFASIGKPLDGRFNVVLTRDPAFRAEGVVVARALSEALDLAGREVSARGCAEIFVIGGGAVYAEALPLADRIYLTEVAAEPSGDTRFPTLDPDAWMETSREALPRGPRDTADAVAVVFDRR